MSPWDQTTVSSSFVEDLTVNNPRVGSKPIDASQRNKKGLTYSSDKIARHEPHWVMGEKGVMFNPNPGRKLRLGGRKSKRETG